MRPAGRTTCPWSALWLQSPHTATFPGHREQIPNARSRCPTRRHGCHVPATSTNNKETPDLIHSLKFKFLHQCATPCPTPLSDHTMPCPLSEFTSRGCALWSGLSGLLVPFTLQAPLSAPPSLVAERGREKKTKQQETETETESPAVLPSPGAYHLGLNPPVHCSGCGF